MSRATCAVCGLVIPLFALGIVLVGMGFAANFQPTATTSSDISLTESTVRGEALYQSHCAACHGVDLRGITGVGKNLVASDFVNGLSDAELRAFIIKGRPLWHIDNTTGIDMPARGGNPALRDTDITAIIAYLRQEAQP